MDIWNIFVFSCNAVLPIVLIVLFGYFLRSRNVFHDDFLDKANKLCFRVLIPILLFYNVGFIDKEAFATINWALILYAFLSIVVLFFLGLVLVIFLVKDPRQKGVVLQSIFRSNYAIIGIPLCEFLAPEVIRDACVGLASIVAAVSIPLFNIFAVIALSIFKEDKKEKISVGATIKKVVTNPLILGVVAGLVVLGIRMLFIENGIDLSKAAISSNFLFKAIENVKNIASPLALMVLGGKFKFSSVKRLAPQIILGTTLRAIIVPAICLLVGYALGFRELEFPTLIALFATPVAVSSVPMAFEMNQDGELAGQFVVWTSIVSIFSLFAIIMICCSVGIFSIV